jgi:16S rRNA (guanine(966)-N(2))-methyltransferase RsmD
MRRPSKLSIRGASQVRIGGGDWRSRLLAFPNIDGLRPTGDRIKQTLFNWLGQNLSGKNCLDAYAGSGALGFEAASRGAARVVLCEIDPTALQLLKQNATALHARQCEIIPCDVKGWLATSDETFDVAFCDPPFSGADHAKFLRAVLPHLAPDGLVYVESNTPIDALLGTDSPYAIAKQRKAGAVYFGLLRLHTPR